MATFLGWVAWILLVVIVGAVALLMSTLSAGFRARVKSAALQATAPRPHHTRSSIAAGAVHGFASYDRPLKTETTTVTLIPAQQPPTPATQTAKPPKEKPVSKSTSDTTPEPASTVSEPATVEPSSEGSPLSIPETLHALVPVLAQGAARIEWLVSEADRLIKSIEYQQAQAGATLDVLSQLADHIGKQRAGDKLFGQLTALAGTISSSTSHPYAADLMFVLDAWKGELSSVLEQTVAAHAEAVAFARETDGLRRTEDNSWQTNQ